MLPCAQLIPSVIAYEPVVQLALAVVLGGLIGLEREFHGRPAGLRTHILVCLGTTMVMLAAARLYEGLQGTSVDPLLRIDPGRVAAGVLTGIGFIGAGAILRLRGTHRGLTTAACTWLAAATGVAIGMGAYGVAVAGTLIAVLVLVVLHEVEKGIQRVEYRELVVIADLEDGMFARVRDTVRQMGLHPSSGEFMEDIEHKRVHIMLSVRYRGHEMGAILARHLRELPGVHSISWHQEGI
jgi:putative Mg2+ transporter-C (MgtC) family protein